MTPERQQKLRLVLSKRQNDITIVLENVFDPHNISAVMRTCDASRGTGYLCSEHKNPKA